MGILDELGTFMVCSMLLGSVEAAYELVEAINAVNQALYDALYFVMLI